MEQHMVALAQANEVRSQRAAIKRKLRGSPLRELIPALVHPTPELATYRLGMLFAGSHRLGGGVIAGANRATLSNVFSILNRENLRFWHDELRLGDLTVRERRRLVKEILRLVDKGCSHS